MPKDPQVPALTDLLGAVRRRGWLIAVCVVLVAGGALSLSRHESRRYTASASVAFDLDPLNAQIAGLAQSSAGSLAAQQASNLELLRLGDMAAKTAVRLGDGLSARQVQRSMSVTGQGESSVAEVSASAATPRLAAAIANTYAEEFVKEQQVAKRQYFHSALALVRKQLAALSPRQQAGGAGVALQERAENLSLLSDLNYGSVQVAQSALAPSTPSSPKTSRNTVLGAFIGLVIGLTLAFVLERLDGRMRRSQELEELYGAPLLGSIAKEPMLGFGSRNREDGERQPGAARAFDLIRAHLRAFGRGRDVRSVLVASAARGEGTSSIARGLAEAAAAAGSRTLLIETDPEQPTLAARLAIEAAPGLFEVLAGSASLSEALRSVELHAGAAGGPELDVLCAGEAQPRNTIELLESVQLDALLNQAGAMHDLIVIDTPPLSVLPDAMTLLGKVDGVLVVGRLGRGGQADAVRLREVLRRSGAVLLGVIATGERARRHSPKFSHASRPAADEQAADEATVSAVELVPAGKA